MLDVHQHIALGECRSVHTPQLFFDLGTPFPPLSEDVDKVYVVGMQVGHRFRIVTVPGIGKIGNYFLTASSSV
ncbi:MAG: hypothetical protein ABSH40_17465 [Bryobacteraceae bacterium]